MSRPTPFGLSLLSGAALLALAACSDSAVVPEVRAPEGASYGLLDAGKSKKLQSNRVRYRESAGSNATGRSGTATLVASAILGGDGITRLTVISGGLRDPGSGRGELAKVQVKGIVGGSAIFTNNFQSPGGGAGRATLELTGLGPADSVRVQANIRGIDGRRTDVVTVTARVALPPALRADIDLPDEVPAGVPVLIVGTVTETNGDSGGSADCQLWIDGVLVDLSRNIWVDAGDAVTCAFTHTFPDDGEHVVEIRLLPPSDANASLLPAPVGDRDVVNVVSPSYTSWHAVVHDRTETTSWRLDYDWANPVTGSNKTYRSNDSEAHRTQTVNVTGGVNRALAFPLLNVSLSLESGGTAWQAEAWGALVPVVNPATGEACVTRDVPEHQAVFYVCGAGGAGSFGYSRLAGTVTYHSDAYIRLFDGLTGVQDVWGVERHLPDAALRADQALRRRRDAARAGDGRHGDVGGGAHGHAHALHGAGRDGGAVHLRRQQPILAGRRQPALVHLARDLRLRPPRRSRGLSRADRRRNAAGTRKPGSPPRVQGV